VVIEASPLQSEITAVTPFSVTVVRHPARELGWLILGCCGAVVVEASPVGANLHRSITVVVPLLVNVSSQPDCVLVAARAAATKKLNAVTLNEGERKCMFALDEIIQKRLGFGDC
jgi:hypothetical protein